MINSFRTLGMVTLLVLSCGCCVIEGIGAKVRSKSTVDLVVVNADRTPASNIVVTTQESGWRHVLPLLLWFDPSWVATGSPRNYVSDSNGLCRIRFGDDKVRITSVSRGSQIITNYVATEDLWWASWLAEEDRRRPMNSATWDRAYVPNTQQLLGHKVELTLNE